MRYLALSALVLCGFVSGCSKKHPAAPPAPTPAPAATPMATATPVPIPEPVAINRNARAIVLCYHRFEDKPKDSLAISPVDFEAQMQALKDQGVTVIPMDDLLAWRRGEKSIPAKAAVVTIDDGYLSGYTKAWPILKKFGYPFTMFIYTDYVKGGPKSGGQSMTWDELAEMRDAGVDIESHTVSHSDLNAKKGKTEDQYKTWLHSEVYDSKQMLEQKLGIQIKVFAYPYGKYNSEVRQMVKDAGYEAAFTVFGQHIPINAEATMLGRYAIESNKPAIFKEALDFDHGATAAGATTETAEIEPGAGMVTVPKDGETISDPLPELKVDLAPFGAIDPKTINMRLSGIGIVSGHYDPQTKMLTCKLQQKLRAHDVTVIVSAMGGGHRQETHWTFHFDPNAPAAAASPAAVPAAAK